MKFRFSPATAFFAAALLPLAAGAERIAPLAPLDLFPPQVIPQPLDLEHPMRQAEPRRSMPPVVIEAPSRGMPWLIRPLSPEDRAVPVQVVPAPTAPIPPTPPATEAQPWNPPEEPSPPAPQADSGADLIERGIGTLLDNLLREMEPTFDSMAEGLDDLAMRFGPALEDLGLLIDDIGNYQAPERLPNGDILIRRRPDAPPPPAFPGGEEAAPLPQAPPVDPAQPQIDL